jgi:hypothetical protein
MSTRFASEKKAFGFCDRCTQRYPLKKLKTYVVKGRVVNMRVCPACWDPDHPQLWVGIYGSQKAADDPQALRNPRPDTNENDSRGFFSWAPVATQQIDFTVNSVFVSIS